jgi:D-3-phosphoglycerate dehydrogenase / 2-oxoglutarate reductase
MKSLFIDCNDQLAPVWQQVVRADDPPIDVNRAAFAPGELPRLLEGYAICIDDHSYLPTALAERCASLKHVVFLGTGAASYMNVDELAARGVRVHTIKGYGDTAVAEHTIALMVAACRDVARMDREIRSGSWVTREGMQLSGKTLGIIGLGGIGSEVARIGRGIGMQVIAWNRTPRPDDTVVELNELLAQRPHPPCRPRRLSERAAAARSPARGDGQRHADRPRGLPNARSLNDAAPPRDRHREGHP